MAGGLAGFGGRMKGQPFRLHPLGGNQRGVTPASPTAIQSIAKRGFFMADVFVSYKREELSRAAAVAKALESEGFSVFYDLGEHGIQAGETWDKRLEHELAIARCCLVLWSPASTQSDNVRSEARRGKARGILVPALINPCIPPIGLDTVQAADLSRWIGELDAPQWRFLVDRGIGPKLGRPEPAKASVASGSDSPRGTTYARSAAGAGIRRLRGQTSSRLGWLAGVAALVIAMSLAYWGVVLKPEQAPPDTGPAPSTNLAPSAQASEAADHKQQAIAKSPIVAPAERPDRPFFKAKWQQKYEELFLATDAEISPFLGNWCFREPGNSSGLDLIVYLGGTPKAYYLTAKYSDGSSVTDDLGQGKKKFTKPVKGRDSLFLPLDEDRAIELWPDKTPREMSLGFREAGASQVSPTIHGQSCN